MVGKPGDPHFPPACRVTLGLTWEALSSWLRMTSWRNLGLRKLEAAHLEGNQNIHLGIRNTCLKSTINMSVKKLLGLPHQPLGLSSKPSLLAHLHPFVSDAGPQKHFWGTQWPLWAGTQVFIISLVFY